MTSGPRAILLVKNCSAHREMNILPPQQHTHVLILPKTGDLSDSNLYAEVIASVKKQKRRRKIRRAVDLINLGETEVLYDSDMRIVMDDIYDT